MFFLKQPSALLTTFGVIVSNHAMEFIRTLIFIQMIEQILFVNDISHRWQSKRKFYDAMNKCIDKGGHLWVPNSREEYDYITNKLENDKSYWIGYQSMFMK